jgi:GNAT superfamily N-acetyltransferase
MLPVGPCGEDWSTFLVAEVGGAAAGTVAGYVPEVMTSETFAAACREAFGQEAERVLAIDGARSAEYFQVPMPGDTVRVEWVYTDPRFRGRGISSALLATLTENARTSRRRTAHVGTYRKQPSHHGVSQGRIRGVRRMSPCRLRSPVRGGRARVLAPITVIGSFAA